MSLVTAQDDQGEVLPEESKYKTPVTKAWFNTYGTIRIGKRLFWDAQTHLRFEEVESTPYLGQIAQIYNRHAIGYIYSKKVNFSLGGVLRLNFNTDLESSRTQHGTGIPNLASISIWPCPYGQPWYIIGCV